MSLAHRARLFAASIVFLAWTVGAAGPLVAHGSPPDPAPQSASAAPEHDPPATAADTDPAWTCPMHPEVRQHEPGQCPKCKMRLVQDAEDPG